MPLVDQHSLELILHNQRSITRIYPSAYRQDSSNVEPVAFWNAGVQMGLSNRFERNEMFSNRFLVALNFQTGDLAMSLNQARFSDNHQCGYILKPPILRDRKKIYL